MVDFSEISPKYSQVEIATFDSEGEFMDANVELLKQTIHLLHFVVESKYFKKSKDPKIISRDEAVIAGNLARLIKLNTSLVQNVCEFRMEICFILSRCLTETAINIMYILDEEQVGSIQNYIKHSLITEKKLLETILKNVKERDGNEEAIERRMQLSIKQSFESSDFEIENVNRSSKWGTFKSRADIVARELYYSVYYASVSHSIHGNWQDILRNNLKKEENGFTVDLNWKRPSPQILDGPIILNLEVIDLFVKRELMEATFSSKLMDKCRELLEYQNELADSHEMLLEKINDL